MTVYWDLSKCALVMSTATARTVAVIATGGDTCAAPMPVPMMARTSVIHTRFVERAPVTPVAAFRVGGSWGGLQGPSGAVGRPSGAFRSGGAGFRGLQERWGGLWELVAGFGVGGSWWERWERWALGPSGAVAVAFGSGGAGFGSGGGREKTFECLVPP